MTPERIAELRKLCEGATPGPWTHKEEGVGGWEIIGPRVGWVCAMRKYYRPNLQGDADFIATSRTALPELLDENQRLRELQAKIICVTLHEVIDADEPKGAMFIRIRVAADFLDVANIDCLADLFRNTLSWKLQGEKP